METPDVADRATATEELLQKAGPTKMLASASGARRFGAMHPLASKPRVVIVGAGFGGLEAAKLLVDKPVRLTVIDRTNHHLFQPLLYQIATAALSPADIAAPIR